VGLLPPWYPFGVDETLPWLPLASQLGVGGLAGFSVGYALKKVGKLFALLLGALFMVMQWLAFEGLVTVHWGELEARLNPLLESESISEAWRRLLSVFTHNLPFAGAFVPGMLVGVRKG
jgi:uncharacterized membrane protein (Fun14 family)